MMAVAKYWMAVVVVQEFKELSFHMFWSVVAGSNTWPSLRRLRHYAAEKRKPQDLCAQVLMLGQQQPQLQAVGRRCMMRGEQRCCFRRCKVRRSVTQRQQRLRCSASSSCTLNTSDLPIALSQG
jgi:hypothetical protein